MAKLTGATRTLTGVGVNGADGAQGPVHEVPVAPGATRALTGVGVDGADGAQGPVHEVPAAPPTEEQHRAADPERSVWVSASAGTGKTRVLSNRMLRLLLHGNDPANILCLTYTKAGAAEMARRVQDDLSKFAVLPDEVLALTLSNLLGRPAKDAEFSRARAGLLRVLDLPAGLRIMTIHSFCQSLLRRFPLEAEVSPHFELLEPRAAAALLERARDEVLISRNPELRQAVETLAIALGEFSLTEGLNALNAKRAEFARKLLDVGGVDELLAELNATLGVEPGMTVDRLRQAVCSDPGLDEPALLAAASALATGTKTDVATAERLRPWIEADEAGRLGLLPDYRLAFLTAKDEARKKLATKNVSEKFPHIVQALETEQARLLAFADREKALKVAERTAALLRVGAAIIQAYERRKQAESKLDYTDLIQISRRLLGERDSGDWVRYKLDQRIDHLLIDESQDTSPDQWDIVEAMIDDFFSGDSGREVTPTLFVVGDEKQSIFGFQGADVETFQQRRKTFQGRAEMAGLPFPSVPLERSFRSAPAVLRAVDAVFADPCIGTGVHSGDDAMQHRAFKEKAPGLVEIWPLVEGEKTEEAGGQGWILPDRTVFADPAELRLARAIAWQIQSWLKDNVPLAGQDRPIRPKDIMILLPRRGVMQDYLVRELKRNAVPVAGADRIALTDELAVMDLMALGDALLLPEDDLTMAALLRSPLFGLSDEELFTLAHDRGDRPLYRRLHDLRHVTKKYAEADERFSALLAKVDYTPPYEFFASFLAEGAPNGRRLLLRRLGAAAALPIEAFLAQAITYERSNPPSMQGFLHWLRADSDAIKRDAQDVRDEVRVLTVHGSKGLEAPIVFLADATYQKTLQKDRLLWREDGLPLWKVAKDQQDPQSQAIYAVEEERQQAEHRRLLYVAMTRAEERLIVTGCQRGKSREQKDGLKTWYDMIEAGMARLLGAMRTPVTLRGVGTEEGWRFGDAPADDAVAGQATLPFMQGESKGAPMPDWLRAAARGEMRGEALRPSADPADEDPPAASPLSDETERRFGRGLLIHRLLQILPDVPASERPDMLKRYLAKPGFRLDQGLRDEIAGQILAIISHPDWGDFFGPSSRGEVPLIGEVGGQRISGQVDRLAVLPDRVIVLDYKTNRPPPTHPEDVPVAYSRQMTIYRALLREIYPARDVQCALLWTEGPDLMVLGEDQLTPLEPALSGSLDNIASIPTSA